MSGGKGEGLIVFFAPFLACVVWLKGKGNDCNAGYYRFLSPTPHPPPPALHYSHNLVLIKFIFFSFDS